MAVPGNWTLFYDWGSDGTYAIATFTFNNDGTFTDGAGLDGIWFRHAHMLIFKFDNFETTYAGKLAGLSVTGVMSTFDGLEGFFYMLQEGVPTVFAANRVAGKPNAHGK